MISSFVRALVSAFKARRELALENVALRQQLTVLRRSVKRPRLSLWVLPPLSVGEMTLRLYTALNYSQNSARLSTDSPRARADQSPVPSIYSSAAACFVYCCPVLRNKSIRR